ncbi:antibiotic biosynthesis monooxygenase [Maridesulfovibrio sp.]|uniref:putative quinol monooxygenase n=1 Tax=Maridesulfovibrio sp. TaxID=2795000 RepID=UPI0029CA76DF|nr:antibiotic biosynthesis monooxygenase [Maridesulfovibrio sp.]
MTARIKAKSGCVDELRARLEKSVGGCAGQEGLLIYYLHQDKDDPALFMVYGHFSSEASYRMHMDSELLRKTYDDIVGLVESLPEVKFWTMLEKTGV